MRIYLVAVASTQRYQRLVCSPPQFGYLVVGMPVCVNDAFCFVFGCINTRLHLKKKFKLMVSNAISRTKNHDLANLPLLPVNFFGGYSVYLTCHQLVHILGA